MVRSLWCLAFAALLGACEPSTSGVKIASTQKTTYASVRIFDFMDDAANPQLDTFLTIENELPVAFGGLTAPVVTDYQQAAVGTWTAYLSLDGTPLVTSAVQTPPEGPRITLVETGEPGATGHEAPVLGWVPEAFPTLAAGQAGVRFVLGAPSLTNAGDQVSLTGPDAPIILTSNAVIGQMTDWMQVLPTATALAIGGATTFPIATPAAGSLHTYAVVVTDAVTSAVEAIDITESATGNSSASSLIEPASSP